MGMLLGVKAGMTRLFAENGASRGVTVIDLSSNRVCQLRTMECDGYTAVQIAFGVRRRSRLTKADVGHLAKHAAGAARRLAEMRCSPAELEGFTPGQELSASLFAPGQYVDVTATSKGRGFAGVIRRHNFRSGRATHGCSRAHRAHGSTGQNQTPGRVFRGKKMAGHMGARRSTVMSLRIERVDIERNLLFVGGSVPGPRRGDVTVSHAVKRKAAPAALPAAPE